jgi:hypothetical protein
MRSRRASQAVDKSFVASFQAINRGAASMVVALRRLNLGLLGRSDSGVSRRIEVAKELWRVSSVTNELAKTSWPDPDLQYCQQDIEFGWR